ncbi:MAG: hypothetical protein PHU71_03340 [Candidatus Gracilibacteria bacterium]|nr:hypothetical protein [Candidatus Gracilibacteria bacterium]
MPQEDFKILQPNEEIHLSPLAHGEIPTQQDPSPTATATNSNELILKLIIEKEDHATK